MAIQKFITANVTNMAVFKEWLDTYKATSFLKDYTVELSTTVSTNDTITITGENNSVVFKTFAFASSSESTPILTCGTGEGTSDSYVFTRGSYERAVYITGALLCNNGLIIKLYLHSYYNNSNYYATEYVMITKDSAGNLAIVIPRINANANAITITTNNNGFRAIGYNQSKIATITVSTTFNESRTSICPILIDNNYDVTLSEVYQCLQSQLNGIIFDTIQIGDEVFISNGYWAVKD